MNKRSKYIALIFSILIFFYTKTTAQNNPNYNPINIAQAIEIALKNNSKIMGQKVERDWFKSERKISINEQFPEVNLQGNYHRISDLNQYEAGGLFSTPTTYQTIKNMYGANLDASVTLYGGGALKYKKKLSEINEAKSELKINRTEKEIKLEIITTFLEAYNQFEQKKLINANIVEDHALIKQISALKKEGVVTLNEILRAKLQLAEHQMLLNTTTNNISIAEDYLKTVLGLPVETFLKIDTNAVLDLKKTLLLANDANELLLKDNDEIKLNTEQVDALVYQKKIILANYLPQLSFVAQYGYNYPNYRFFPPQAHLFAIGNLGINFKFNLSNLYKNGEKVKQASQQIQINKMERKNLFEKINHAVFTAKTRYNEALVQINLAKINVQQAEENYRLVKLKYKNQLSLITELIDANNLLMKAKSTLITCEIQKNLKFYQYKFALGQL